MGAARLSATAFVSSHEPIFDFRPNPLSVSLRFSPDLQLGDAGQIDGSGELEAIYRDITRYRCSSASRACCRPPPVSSRIWSGRRALPAATARKKGAKAFVAMRSLRKSSFDENFYRLQLSNQPPRLLMDPVTPLCRLRRHRRLRSGTGLFDRLLSQGAYRPGARAASIRSSIICVTAPAKIVASNRRANSVCSCNRAPSAVRGLVRPTG
ncbi:MAG: hypothetical protein WDN06_15200 [Asticcacaulis sp.]